ncbi:MAG: hypothetical protein M0Z53_09905 [Thermaerobacter sp.]|nr:hypothetical protein [Thermaerobacter sp.]
MPTVNLPPRDGGGKIRIPHADKAPKKPSGVFNERHTRAQDPLYDEWLRAQTVLEVVYTDGTFWTGMLHAYDTYGLHMIGADGQDVLIFKQGLRSIRPVAV